MHRIEVDAEIDVLEANRRLAAENREFLKKHGITAINIMGATGSGKTLLIEKTADALGDKVRMGAILGDVVGKADYERVARHGVKAEMINTGKECHLDAHLIHHAIEKFNDVDLLLMENVGNLICPVDFDLGEDYRVVMVSVTEGDDVIEKHPEIFRLADVIIINKVALAEAVEANVDKMVEDARKLNAKAKIIKMDLKKDVGFDEWLEWLQEVMSKQNGR
ncbi:hydrogenase nickel incorporation protein HypB [Archaeoglobus veneficus]|uniref:Hydrogenase accessory protein HypB n=1 Tax=Archaeoglobus veneficus (strain DSM 11195 / SNP6) TaxID=693661 RepID=F2KNA0_ARCVS|nr:hydrogenase nickel incorporation protein HypB [Archaeoglobus veneficus]AEA46201.1 hydrogenase accessory protein HypB [Archaeoglobus veneficus SNP6]